ncbi:hypothetical protein MNBD_GAMMA09-144 [hydrothermal vent metagenome]|uniref:Uncharacterized protein n=1 Tax=hydrothermal vent metagenome TaxID=652676 RepID=A0A3B0XS53_9ZZZZ
MKLAIKKNKCVVSIQVVMSIVSLSLFNQAVFAASDATMLRHSTATPAGGKLEVEVSGGGDVRWILPGQRALDPAVFGTPAAPLGFEPGVGVPIAARLKNADGSAWTTTAMPTPFSDNYKKISGSFKLELKDQSIYDSNLSKDKVNFSAEFTSPDGANSYKVMVKKVIPVGIDHPFLGGVATNFVQHGMTGIGTRLMPTAFTYVAFWGVGRLQVNGVEVANNRVVHMMTTCAVRDADYKLVFDQGVDCSKIQTHLLLSNVAVTPDGPVTSPVPTEFILGNGMAQPFMHIMFGDNKISGVETVNNKVD